MQNTFKDFVIKATFEEDKETGDIIFKTPFVRYREEVWCDGVNVTYSYRADKSLIGKTAVVFTQAIENHPTLSSEVEKAEKYENTLGISVVDVQTKAAEKQADVMATLLEKEASLAKVGLITLNYKPVIAVAVEAKEEPIVEDVVG